jgi:transcription antitermination factor NusG
MIEQRLPPHLLSTPRWYAVFTRSRAEKQVSARLERGGIESYVPIVTVLRQWKDRKKAVSLPVFPGYVFGYFTLREMHTVLSIPGVSTIVRANGIPTPIPDDEFRNVQAFASAVTAAQLDAEPAPLVEEGEWIEVLDGPFAGVVGRAIERRGQKRLLVGLSTIGQGLEVDIDARLLRVIPPPAQAKAA